MDDDIRRPIRVGIIEDQDDLRLGIASLIADAEGFVSAGSWASMEEALPAIGATSPDVVLVDLGLPGIDGIEGIRRLKAARPELLAVVLTVYEDDDRIFEALCAGACGYLLKTTAAPALLAGLEEAVAGGAPMSPRIARKVVGLFSSGEAAREADARLTPHEVRVLRLMTEGHSYKSAAAELGVSRSTIAFHVRKIYDKLQVQGRSEAVAKAFRGRLLR
jgi:DNA-binding NarL/FixJ family response regulator